MFRVALAALLGLAAFATPAQAELHVSMHDGLVTINASDVTVRQILAEWARVGQTKIVNAEGVAGGPVTLQITDMPEEQALDILLRSAAGYLAAPRPVPIATASHFDRVVITPSSSPSTSPVAATPRPPAQQAQQQLLQAQQQFRPAGPDQDDDAAAPPLPGPAAGGPAFNTFPPAGGPASAPPAPQTPTSAPTSPGGLSFPGTVIPAPTAGGQPGQTGQPGQAAARPQATPR
jgi:hypothetical protein